ncbi:hypothetical protein HYPBUDRAFT_196153 [Hyphopichia burtonii NRRL Y-1933]|uniref:Uncharacterized protein n=1 Tax=Hyphopichia burtonii NRRL Y-1933 TaxID=984485 RepID=A0A1E4RK93_9ASCO|nr:hypothetical protein HYPBUDRAFT_196153 [Hyphopichia burtonii NRRL Y-1933]ODV67505.1 hypothetical protein HYPBUDRAFT_196153 [Hyphopichia burtonii NRRL Y-1933]
MAETGFWQSTLSKFTVSLVNPTAHSSAYNIPNAFLGDILESSILIQNALTGNSHEDELNSSSEEIKCLGHSLETKLANPDTKLFVLDSQKYIISLNPSIINSVLMALKQFRMRAHFKEVFEIKFNSILFKLNLQSFAYLFESTILPLGYSFAQLSENYYDNLGALNTYLIIFGTQFITSQLKNWFFFAILLGVYTQARPMIIQLGKLFEKLILTSYFTMGVATFGLLSISPDSLIKFFKNCLVIVLVSVSLYLV